MTEKTDIKEVKELTLAEKLNNAIANIKPVEKDGTNSYQNYRFQSEAAIKAAVKKEMASNGFSIIPHYEILGQRDIKGRKGINHIVDVMGTFTITDGRTDQEIVGTMPGSGMDTGEKAMAKACTSSQKYFYKQLFNITDKDEDPDAINSNIQAKPQQQSQQHYYQRPNGYQSQTMQTSQTAVSNARKQAYHNALTALASVSSSSYESADKAVKAAAKKDPKWATAKDDNERLAICINTANQLGAEFTNSAPQA